MKITKLIIALCIFMPEVHTIGTELVAFTADKSQQPEYYGTTSLLMAEDFETIQPVARPAGRFHFSRNCVVNSCASGASLATFGIVVVGGIRVIESIVQTESPAVIASTIAFCFTISTVMGSIAYHRIRRSLEDIRAG
jgi:hypothetical protein